MFLLLSACYNPTLFLILWRHAMKHQPIGFAFVTIRWFGMETWDHPELRSAGTDCHVFIHPSPPSLDPSLPPSSLLPPPPPCLPASFSFAPGNEFPRRRLHSAGDWRVKRADGCVGKRSALTWQSTRVSRGGAMRETGYPLARAELCASGFLCGPYCACQSCRNMCVMQNVQQILTVCNGWDLLSYLFTYLFWK